MWPSKTYFQSQTRKTENWNEKVLELKRWKPSVSQDCLKINQIEVSLKTLLCNGKMFYDFKELKELRLGWDY